MSFTNKPTVAASVLTLACIAIFCFYSAQVIVFYSSTKLTAFTAQDATSVLQGVDTVVPESDDVPLQLVEATKYQTIKVTGSGPGVDPQPMSFAGATEAPFVSLSLRSVAALCRCCSWHSALPLFRWRVPEL